MGWKRAHPHHHDLRASPHHLNNDDDGEEEGEVEDEDDDDERDDEQDDDDSTFDDNENDGEEDEDEEDDEDEDYDEGGYGRSRTYTNVTRTKPTTKATASSKAIHSNIKQSSRSFLRKDPTSHSHSSLSHISRSYSGGGVTSMGEVQTSLAGGKGRVRPRAKSSSVLSASVKHPYDYYEQPTHTSSALTTFKPIPTTNNYLNNYRTNTNDSHRNTNVKKSKTKGTDGSSARARTTRYASATGSSRRATTTTTHSHSNHNHSNNHHSNNTINTKKVKKKTKSHGTREMTQFDAFISDRGEWTHASTSMMRAGVFYSFLQMRRVGGLRHHYCLTTLLLFTSITSTTTYHYYLHFTLPYPLSCLLSCLLLSVVLLSCLLFLSVDLCVSFGGESEDPHAYRTIMDFLSTVNAHATKERTWGDGYHPSHTKIPTGDGGRFG